ncbi:MAG: BatA domain-containing protein [Pirellulales bacterium]
MPSFLAGAFAVAGLVAATGPVIIHLLNRRRFRTVEWAAMDFLREAVQRSRRILHLRDLLLLALRTLCVLLFGLALARPFFARSNAATAVDQPVHAVLVIDNSLSMGYERLTKTLLDDAKAKAREFIDLLPEGSRISVLPLCGSAAGFSRDAYRTREDALDALAAIEVVDRAGTVAQAVDLAAEACRRLPDLPSKRIAFLSDQQRVNWPSESLAAGLAQLPEMQIVDLAPDEPENAWIADFKVRDGIADVETSTVFVATVRYEGAAPRTNVPVTLSVDGAAVASRTIDLAPGQSREVTFAYRLDVPTEPGRPAFATAEVSIPADHLPADDHRWLVAPVVAALPVVFVDQYGDEEDPRKDRFGESFRLRRLLAPVTARDDSGKQLIQTRHLRIDQVDRTTLRDARLVVVAGVESPGPTVSLLRDYVRQGGQLVITAGGQFDPAAWTSAAWLDGAGILPAPLESQPIGRLPEETEKPPVPFALAPETMVGDYFLLEDTSREELDDLYRLPDFFKAVKVDLGDKVLAAMVAAEAGRIEAARQFLAEDDARRAESSKLQASGKPDNAQRQATAGDAARRAEIEPSWLVWSQPPATEEATAKPADLAERSRPRQLAAYTNGAAFMVERAIGRGRVLFVSSGVLSSWNTLTKTNAVLMFDRIFRAMLERTLPERNLTTVEQIALPIDPSDRRARYALSVPGGNQEPLSVDALGADVYGITVHNAVQRGIYRVTAYRSENGDPDARDSKLWEIPLAVNGPERESELAPLGPAAVGERMGQANYRWIARGEPIRLEGAQIRGQNLWLWLIASVLACLLVELVLVGRPKEGPA